MDDDDPWRMFLVVRRGAFDELSVGSVLAGAAAVRCVREFADDPVHGRPSRPGASGPGR